MFQRVQHRFGAMRYKCTNDGRRDDRNFNGGIWDKNTLVGAEFAYFDRCGLWASFKIKVKEECGMKNK